MACLWTFKEHFFVIKSNCEQNEAVKRSIERARGEKALKDQLADKRAENEAKTLEYYKKSKDVKAKMAFIQENL